MLKLQMKLTERLRALQEREEGQAMVEYALILALVSVAAVITPGGRSVSAWTGRCTTIVGDL